MNPPHVYTYLYSYFEFYLSIDEGVEKGRTKIAQMSSEVVDSNPYSRLMALKITH